jgi:hypothetical protein
MDMRKSNRSLQQWPLAYSTFTPNAEVPAGKFNLDALELPENSRILDQRPNAPQRSYHYFRADKAEKKTEDLRDQVRTMPITPKIDNDFEPTFTGRRALLFTLALFSMLCVCLGVFFWWRKRKKTRLDRG